MLSRRGLGSAYWSARFGFCFLVVVGHGVGFFLLLLNMGFCSGGILVGSGGVVEARWW